MTTLRRMADAARRSALLASGRAIVLALSLVVSAAGPARAQQDSIALILANPQKYWNLQVTVAGMVDRANAALTGSQAGTYRLTDYTDSTGIAVVSEDLPAPGRVFRVRGIVVPSPENATIPVIRERSRDALDKPSWLLAVVIGAGALAVALLLALLFVLRRRGDVGAAPLDAARPPVPIVIGGPLKMMPPPVYMPWANPGARTSGALPRPSLDGPLAPPRVGPGVDVNALRMTPGGTPVQRLTPGGTPVQRAMAMGTPASMGTGLPPQRPSMPGRGAGAPPLTQPFEASAPRTEPFEYTGARLEVDEGPDAGKRLPIGSSNLLIGREGGRRNHLTLTDRTVSLAQASIVRDDAQFRLVNESKTNRTLVNGEPVHDPIPLEDGAEIRMGATVVRFRLGA